MCVIFIINFSDNDLQINFTILHFFSKQLDSSLIGTRPSQELGLINTLSKIIIFHSYTFYDYDYYIFIQTYLFLIILYAHFYFRACNLRDVADEINGGVYGP